MAKERCYKHDYTFRFDEYECPLCAGEVARARAFTKHQAAHQEAEIISEKLGLLPLEKGSPKQRAWANEIRVNFLHTNPVARSVVLNSGYDFLADAKWWIDNRLDLQNKFEMLTA